MARVRSWREWFCHQISTGLMPSHPPRDRSQSLSNHFIILTLRSLDSPAYSSVKRFVDGVLKGEVLKSPIGQAVWNPFLGNTAAAPQLMSPLEQKYGVVFQCIPSKKTVRMYGSPEKVKDAQKAWKDVGMPLNHPSVKSIELDDQSLTWILTGGFEAISDAIGSESVMFNTLSTPKTVEILGPSRLCKTAETMLSQRKRVPQSAKDRAGRCSICLRKAEDPISANSGHFYCLACFESYCLSNFGHTNGGILTCPAEGGSCGALFQLEQLQQLLSSFTFERILISSFHTFRWHHGEELTYCSSNHCRQLRRKVQSDLSKFPCQVCDKNASPYVVSSDEIDLEYVPNVPHRVDNLGRNSRLNAKTVPSALLATSINSKIDVKCAPDASLRVENLGNKSRLNP